LSTGGGGRIADRVTRAVAWNSGVVGRKYGHAGFAVQWVDVQVAGVGGEAYVADVSAAVVEDGGLVRPGGA
jgi:hypothetical protein